MKILAFIPARSGSKGIRNKNMAMFNKKPLIYYTLKTVKKIDKDIFPFVSTDSKEIKKYCEKKGIKSDYLRPKILSKDNSTIYSAINHAIDWLRKNKNKIFESVLLLQPTSPLRDLKELKSAVKQFKRKKLQSLVSVTRMKEHPYECIKYVNKKWDFLVKNPSRNSVGRQSYKKHFYFIDGSFYLAKVNFLKKNKNFVVRKKTKIFKTSQFPGIDIDYPVDIKLGELFMNKKKK